MRTKATLPLLSLSVVFPAYNDAKSLPLLLEKASKTLPKITSNFEIIIVNDASNDTTSSVLKKLQETIPYLQVVTHRENRGYGGALMSGFKKASKKYIFYTDSDGQYDVGELPLLVALLDKNIDVVTGYKKKRSDSYQRKIIGACYNQFVRFLFQLRIKDTDCDFRLFRRDLLKGLRLQTASGAFDVEFITKLQKKGARFREVGVSHYPRAFGKSEFFRFSKIFKSLKDVFALWFSMQVKRG